ncbi:unnamed protein product [Brachionus calyciflorus]|uniref:Uncharacterized protein n=1 Tax=Brachionus calyciflorus TaxID=104777 RepID=A0A814PPS8_9BILA|nr:unnamed protein product [Brachionus calyciflorus]
MYYNINKTISTLIGKNIEYLSKINKPLGAINTKRKNIETYENSEQFEEQIFEAVEHYGKKLKLDLVPAQGYQKAANVEYLCQDIQTYPKEIVENPIQYNINGLFITKHDLSLLVKKNALLNEVLIESYVSLFNDEQKILIEPNTTAYNILIESRFEFNNKVYYKDDDFPKYCCVVGAV